MGGAELRGASYGTLTQCFFTLPSSRSRLSEPYVKALCNDEWPPCNQLPVLLPATCTLINNVLLAKSALTTTP
eukprot:8503433-Lingulodinium_polyedra.AAC.1